MKLILLLIGMISSVNAMAEAYDGDPSSLSYHQLSPFVDFNSQEKPIIFFVDPACIACSLFFKNLNLCASITNAHFYVVGSTQQTLETLNDKFWYLSSGGELPPSESGCQIGCTGIKNFEKKDHSIEGMDEIDVLMRVNKLARNTAIWQKYLGENSLTPSYLDLEDMSSGVVKDANHARELASCI